MSTGEIKVNTDGLGAGGDSCQYAAGSARRAANRLGEATVSSGIFGDFAEAQTFRSAVSVAHQRHREQLETDHSTLAGLSGKADTAAAAFTNTDESGAAQIESAAGGIE